MKTLMKIAARMTGLMLALVMLLCVSAGCLAEENKIWGIGDEGEKVTFIQQRLQELEYLDRAPTGVYDEETAEAVKKFQRQHGLLQTGQVEETTMRLLESETQHAWEDWGYDICVEEEAAMPVGTAMPAPSSMMATGNGYAAKTGAWESDGYWNTDEYNHFASNGFVSVAVSPLSTFAADVDTSSYSQFRRRVLSGDRIPADSIRVEEMMNYFRYDYKGPEGDEPFGVTLEYAPCPWNEKTMLLQIGVQAKTVKPENRPGHNLVFLIDTSGSMYGSDRLDLVKRAFLLLLEELDPEDTVSIVAYASQDRVVIEGVKASEKTRIMEAISDLEAGGSTNGGAGIMRAYEIAGKYKIDGGVNRILLATDGDLNVGMTSEGDLANLVSEKRKEGISLTCLGFGFGNYKDNKMEALADYGDGNCWYIDTIHEARRALVTEGGGTFITVAKDVKIQVDFNPALVQGYRLIGYEDRLLAAEDFADDTRDGGEIGSGHQMTALYEIVPAGSDFDFGATASRYQIVDGTGSDGEIATVSIRAKEPEGTESRLYEYPVAASSEHAELSDNLRFASAVVMTCMVLRNDEWMGTSSYAQAQELLRGCESVTGDAYREEFLYLVNLLEREAK